MEQVTEQWKVIVGFPDYEVSDLGRVRRISPARGTGVGKVLQPGTKKDGRLLVALRKDGNHHTKAVHVLVAKAFIPNPQNLPEVNHLGPLSDCRAVRLEWRSRKGNILHAMQNNLCKGDGVYFIKRDKKWEARYSPTPGNEVRLGHFFTKEDALTARKNAIDNYA